MFMANINQKVSAEMRDILKMTLSRGRPQKWSEGWNTSPVRKGWDSWGCSAAFQYLKGTYKKAGEGLFTRARSDSTRGNGFKLKEGRFKSNIRKKFFTMRVVRHWNRLPRDAVAAPSLEAFQGQAGWGFEQTGLVEDVPGMAGGLELDGLWGHFQPKPFYDSMILWSFRMGKRYTYIEG